MKVSEVDILIVPGLGGSDTEHWQSRWQTRLSTARRVEQPDWDKPNRAKWAQNIAAAVNIAERPVVLVAHSLGVAAALNAIPLFEAEVRGAFLVAPPDLERSGLKPRVLKTFGPYSRDPLPFPSMVIASSNDPYCDLSVAEDLAAAWGSVFVGAGEGGHLNTDSGFGPWPEGSLSFAKLLSRV